MNELQAILDRIKSNGGEFWSREDGNIYSPIGSSTLDTLFVIGETSLATVDNPVIAKAVEFILSYQTSNGAFRYLETSAKLPCLTARILGALGRLSVKDERLEKSYQHLIKLQCEDGGWRCNTVKRGNSPLTDASNPGTTLYLLDAFRFRENNDSVREQLTEGLIFYSSTGM